MVAGLQILSSDFLAYQSVKFIELPEHSAISGNWKRGHTSMADFAKYIKLAPDRQFIDTDLGQALNPNPIDGMRAFIQGLRAEGITDDQLDKLTRKIPAMLIDVSRSTL
jgi:hypothetical protein